MNVEAIIQRCPSPSSSEIGKKNVKAVKAVCSSTYSVDIDKKIGGLHSSESQVEENVNDVASSETDSDKEILRNITSESSSSERIDTDIEAASPNNGNFSSSNDEALLKKFREQQVGKRYRPPSAKLKIQRDSESEPKSLNIIQSKAVKLFAYSSDSSEVSYWKSPLKSPRRKKINSISSSSISERSNSPRSSSISSSFSFEPEKSPPQAETSLIASSYESIPSSDSTKASKAITRKKEAQDRRKPAESLSETEGSSSLSSGPTSLSKSTLHKSRQPSRRGKNESRPQTTRIERPHIRTQPIETKESIERILWKRSLPLPNKPQEDKPRESGFWWPYNEDCRGEKELQKLVNHHKRKLHNLLAQEYLQRHLEIELRRAGARFKQYERSPKSLSLEQVTKLKERKVTWIYLDGKLYNLDKEGMGKFLTKERYERGSKVHSQKGRKRSKSEERSSRSSERSKRSVSFEKGSGSRRRSTSAKQNNSKSSKGTMKNRGNHGRSEDSQRSSEGSRDSSKKPGSLSKLQYGRKVRSRSKSRSQSRNSFKTSRKSSNASKLHKNIGCATATDSPKRSKTAKNTAKTDIRKRSILSKSYTDGETDSGGVRTKRSSSENRIKKNSKTFYARRSSSGNFDDNTMLQKILFTEDSEKRLRKERLRREKKHVMQQNRLPVKDMLVRENIIGAEDEKIHWYSPAITRKQKKSLGSDYNFYQDPNIPGHAFPQYYLAQIFESQRRGKKKHIEDDVRYLLLPAPVNRAPPYRTSYTKRSRAIKKSKIADEGFSATPNSKTEGKVKSIVHHPDEGSIKRSPARESSSSTSLKSASFTQPRIRPGSGRIKCSWKAEKEQEKKKFPGSDHQLKNTENPMVLAWLRRKDAQLRARRQDEIRKQRRKTEKLIDEQYDLDEKHEMALRQYEIWKKNKDREILLRRRKEVKEANSVSISGPETNLAASKHNERQRTAHSIPKTSVSAFSELRSSSTSPSITEKKVNKPRKSRLKPAVTQSASADGNFSRKEQRPRSATTAQKNAIVKDEHEDLKMTENFFEKFLDVAGASRKSKENKTNPKLELENLPIGATKDRTAYEKWVRSSSSSKASYPASDGRKARRKNKKSGKHELPPHNHADNELLSKLAKRRIDNILLNKECVDTGIKRKPVSVKYSPRQDLSKISDETQHKWKIREDNIIRPVIAFEEGSVGWPPENDITSLSSSSSSNSRDSKGERPKFSHKKSHSSANHQRNSVVCEKSDTSN